MASKKAITLISLTLTLLVFASVSSASSPFCSTADDKVLCSQLTKDGKTWAESMTNALKAVQEKAKSGNKIVGVVGSKLPKDLKPQTKESIESTCRESYENILYNIDQCIGFVKNDPYNSLRTYLSAATFSDCSDGLDEFGVSIAEVNDFGDDILKLTSTLLAIAEKKA